MNHRDSVWLGHFMWRCQRHIPSGIMHTASVERCTMCQYPRPDLALRPNMDGSLPEPPARSMPRHLREEPKIVVVAARPEPVEAEAATPEPIGHVETAATPTEPMVVVPDPEPVAVEPPVGQEPDPVTVVQEAMMDRITMDLVVSDPPTDHLDNHPVEESPKEDQPVECPPIVTDPSPQFFMVSIVSDPDPGMEIKLPEPAPVVQAEDYQLFMVSWVDDPIDLLTRLRPPSPEPPQPDRSEAVQAMMQAEDKAAHRARDGAPTKIKLLCPGPKCRKLSRRNSPFCSKACKDRCYRLRQKVAKGVLTDREITWLNRIMVTLEAWDKATAA